MKRANTLNWKQLEMSCVLQDLMKKKKKFSFRAHFCHQVVLAVCAPRALQLVSQPTESRFLRSVGELIEPAPGPKPWGFTPE